MSERKASMSDMVYRGDVIKYIRNNISLDTFMKRTVSKADEACWELCDKLNFVPAIDPVKHGHWIEDGYRNGEIVCSNCGEPCATFLMLKPRDRYCKWCGAKMDKGGDVK